MINVRTQFEVGESADVSKTISEEDIFSFAKITGDYNPVHIDPEFAKKTRFKGCIAHGILSVGFISAVLGTKLPGPGCIYLSQNIKFLRPVRIGDEITAKVRVIDWDPIKKIIRLSTRCSNQMNEDVLSGEAVLLVETVQND